MSSGLFFYTSSDDEDEVNSEFAVFAEACQAAYEASKPKIRRTPLESDHYGAHDREFWNWKHPKSIDFQAKRGFSARDSYIIPISSNEINSSEEYTCVIATLSRVPWWLLPLVVATTPLVYAAEYPDDSKFEECLKRCSLQATSTPSSNGYILGRSVVGSEGISAFACQ
ncbi:hypothetical protein Tco_1084112 [Tanacetum coccineum]